MPSILPKNKEISFTTLIMLLAMTFLLLLLDNIGIFDSSKSTGALLSSAISADFKENMSSLTDKWTLLEEKEQLLEKVESLENEKTELISQNAQLKQENRELSLTEQQQQFTEISESTPALIIGSISDKFGHIVINKGSDSDVGNGDAVVFKNLLLGEVVKVNRKTSEVRLITSQESLIPVTSINHNTQGVSRGSINKALLMQDIPQGGTLEPEELIITSGINSKFIRGLIVGKVRSIDSTANLATKTAELDLVFDFSDIAEVFILDAVEIL